MNTGQMFITLGALALLGTILVTMHKNFGMNNQVIIQSKLGVTAVSLAESIVEEASGKAFDKATDDNAASATTSLTTVANLGLETGEYFPDSVNDFDDYNNYNKTVSFDKGGTFSLKCKISYINPTTPEVDQVNPTWHKKLSITVTSKDMIDTIRTEYIFSYFYFR
jgi:hypothetical protein